MNEEKLNLFEAFAGIGSQLTALRNIGLNVKPVGISEWDIFALESYFYINGFLDDKYNSKEFNFKEEDFFEYFKNNDYSTDSKKINQKLKERKTINNKNYKDILEKIYFIKEKHLNIFPNIEKLRGKDLIDLNVDIFTYSFPCQDLSSAGKMIGFKNVKGEYTRSGLLYEIKRILNEIFENNRLLLPKFLLLENVSTLFSKKYINEYLEWKKILSEFGYSTFDGILNSKDYGIPQFRKRSFAISILDYKGKLEKDYLNKNFDPKKFNSNQLELIIEQYSNHKKKLNKNKLTIENIIKNDDFNDNYIEEIILSIPNHTKSRDYMWKKEKKLFYIDNKENRFAEYCRTLTTKQDRWNNAGMIQLTNHLKNEVYKKTGRNRKYRLITKKEALLFMGFKEKQIDNLLNNSNQSISKIWHQAGNSIVVNVLEAIFELFIKGKI